MYVKSQNHEPGEGDAQAQHSSTAQQDGGKIGGRKCEAQ